MIRLFQFLLHGCAHKWIPTSQSVYENDSGSDGPIVYVRCEKCGRRSYFKNATIGVDEMRHAPRAEAH
ncbi:hypothetical protein GCM10017056_10980 [Seohaeicola zhoushanensis]|uniref:Uncharacterized protein n=1 Tax=Seohaeicola zhoushanensis TaxID=1569283 RepID=A0A8J3GVW6_9RHOB|nr:hypothetical protein GCM10017056_10980 [Seohaeicola zhoushanensis]